ncbi:hypothetical protein ES705_36975 [subsurface metagenome]
MSDISIGNTTIKNPLNLLHDVRKLETYGRTIDGSLIVNRNVTSKGHSIDKYYWTIPGLIKSEMFAIKEEAKRKGNLYLIDHHEIVEVFADDEESYVLQREIAPGNTPVVESRYGCTVVKYIPKYTVHIMSYQHTFFSNTIANYVLICEEI